MAKAMTPGYRTAMIGLRPPRVVLLFPGWENWRGWARLALETTTAEWGGGGYLVIPYDEDGTVDDRLVDACTAYDPDYVEVLTAPPTKWAELAPEYVSRIPDSEGWSAMPHGSISGGQVTVATDLILEATSVMRASVGEDIVRARFKPWPNDGSVAEQLHDTNYLSIDPNWDSDASLFAGAIAGVVRGSDKPEEPTREALLAWCMNPTADRAPAEMHSEGSTQADAAQLVPRAFEAISDDTTGLRRGWPSNSVVVVIGDTVQDFALAITYQRLRGISIWLTTEDVLGAFKGSWRLRHELSTLVQGSQVVNLASASFEPSEIDALSQELDDPHPVAFLNNEPLDTRISPRLGRTLPAFDDAPLRLMLSDHISTSTTVALPVTESESGTFELVAPLDTPLPRQPRFRAVNLPAWIIDVEIEHTSMPGGRGLPPRALLSAGSDQAVEIRASRTGVSFEAGSLGLVLGGTVLAGRVSRPTLRIPGLEDWVSDMAGSRELGTRISAAGRHAALLARRLGSRERLIDVVSGPLHPFLRAFVKPPGRRTRVSDMFPRKDGVLVSDRIVLTFDALVRLTPEETSNGRRDRLDELLEAGLMTQGMVLDCRECGEVFFVSIDGLGRIYACPRCGASNTLISDRWHRDGREPSWYYDVHGALRSMMETNSDAVLLAAAHFRGQTWRYRDTHELEFYEPSEPSRRQFEIDLIAQMGDELVVCEVKSNGVLGQGAKRQVEIKKRFRAAALLRADRVAFVSIDQPWSEGTVKAIIAIQQKEYPQIDVQTLVLSRPLAVQKAGADL